MRKKSIITIAVAAMVFIASLAGNRIFANESEDLLVTIGRDYSFSDGIVIDDSQQGQVEEIIQDEPEETVEVKLNRSIKKIYPDIESSILCMRENKTDFKRNARFYWLAVYYYANNFSGRSDVSVNKSGKSEMSKANLRKHFYTLTGKNNIPKIPSSLKKLVRIKNGKYIFTGSDKGSTKFKVEDMMKKNGTTTLVVSASGKKTTKYSVIIKGSTIKTIRKG